MKRIGTLVLLISLSLAPTLVAEELLSLRVEADGAICIGSAYIKTQINASKSLGGLGLGLNAGLLYGPEFNDLYPYLMVSARLAFFEFGVGASLPLAADSLFTDAQLSDGSVFPMASVGFYLPLLYSGRQTLGINASLDAHFTLIPVQDRPSGLENLLGTIVTSIFSAIKLSAGLSYGLSL